MSSDMTRAYAELAEPDTRAADIIAAESKWLAEHDRHLDEIQRIEPPAHRPEILSVLGCHQCDDWFTYVRPETDAEMFLQEHGAHPGRAVEVRVSDGKVSRRMVCGSCAVEFRS